MKFKNEWPCGFQGSIPIVVGLPAAGGIQGAFKKAIRPANVYVDTIRVTYEVKVNLGATEKCIPRFFIPTGH